MAIQHSKVFASKTDEMREVNETLARAMGWDGHMDTCRMCNSVVEEFRDDLSEREYLISGMCQKCQDGVFGA